MREEDGPPIGQVIHNYKAMIRLAGWFGFIIAAAYVSVPAYAQNPDDALRVYAVKVVRTPPRSKEPLISSGIYLGRGAVITAAHVVGPNLRVLLAGQDFPANVIKQGSSETTDLALLSVDQTHLPARLLLRRNPLCEAPPKAGEPVVVIIPGGTARSRIISRNGFNNFIDYVPIGDSGSGIFRARDRCLLGILNAKISDFYYRMENGRMVRDLGRGSVDVAKQFVPASEIVDFLPPEFRF
jgi:hypothetical protein